MIRVGTCGWSYAEWKGVFYPQNIKAAEMLPFYAEQFSVVEVDATYYRVLPKSSFAAMDTRTPASFRFAIKLPSTVTHESNEGTSAVHPDAQAFVESIEPLLESGKVASILMQFPNAFKPTPTSRDYIERVRAALAGLPLTAEFRNRSWQSNETLELLASLQIGYCNVDGPRFKSLPRPSADVTSDIGYIRFHGRNYATWWKGDAGERYNYLYPIEELQEWAPRVADVASETKETLALFNNHRNGQATVNARQLRTLLGAG